MKLLDDCVDGDRHELVGSAPLPLKALLVVS